MVWGETSIGKQKDRVIKGLVLFSWMRGLSSIRMFIYGVLSADAVGPLGHRGLHAFECQQLECMQTVWLGMSMYNIKQEYY